MPKLQIYGVVEQMADNAQDGMQLMNDRITAINGYIPEIGLRQADAFHLPQLPRNPHYHRTLKFN